MNGPRRSKPRLQRPGIRRELLVLVNGESERQITGLGMREIGPRKHKNTKSTAHETKAKPRISRSDTEKQSSLSLREAVFVFSCFRGPIAVRMSWEPRVNTGASFDSCLPVSIRGSAKMGQATDFTVTHRKAIIAQRPQSSQSCFSVYSALSRFRQGFSARAARCSFSCLGVFVAQLQFE